MALSVTRRLTEFASRGVALLRIDADCQKLIEETRYGGTRFSLNFPHRIAAKARSESLALIAVQGESQCLRVGLIRSVQPTSTFDSRVVVDLVHSIAPGSLGALLSTVTEASLRTGVRNLENGEESLQS